MKLRPFVQTFDTTVNFYRTNCYQTNKISHKTLDRITCGPNYRNISITCDVLMNDEDRQCVRGPRYKSCHSQGLNCRSVKPLCAVIVYDYKVCVKA